MVCFLPQERHDRIARLGQIRFILTVSFPGDEPHGIRWELGRIERAHRQLATVALLEQFDSASGNQTDAQTRFDEPKDRLPSTHLESDIEGLVRCPITPGLKLFTPRGVGLRQDERESDQLGGCHRFALG
jgi:hypothetical protein